MKKCFTEEPLMEVMSWLTSRMEEAQPGEIFDFEVLSPDQNGGVEGQPIIHAGRRFVYRSLKTWFDLAERLGLKLLLPQPAEPPFITIRFQMPKEPGKSLHSCEDASKPLDLRERYGADSNFGRIDKLEEPHFLADYCQALNLVKLPAGARILSIGVNNARELAPFQWLFAPRVFSNFQFVGIDYSKSAIARAMETYPGPQFRFLCADVAELKASDLGRFHLLLSIDTLQSSTMDGKDVFLRLAKQNLHEKSAVILGFPNSRFVSGEIQYGARLKNYNRPDLSLLVKDLFFYRRYLQKRGYRVQITGKYTVFLTAIRM